MEKAKAFIQKLANALCCCFINRSNPEELLPLKPSQNRTSGVTTYSHEKESPLPSTILSSTKPDQPFFEPTIEDIINQISSGDEDDPIDPSQEEKYEQILKGIED